MTSATPNSQSHRLQSVDHERHALAQRLATLREAIRTSVAATGTHPVEMASWAALIMLLTLAGSLTLVGLAVVVPLLGHATWHAYRDLAGR